MADKKIDGSLEITGKLNPNTWGYGFNFPSNTSWRGDRTIATEQYIDDALSEIEIGLNGKTYKASGTIIELPELAEVKAVLGNYPEYIEATVDNGMVGKISWEELQASINDGSIDFANHTFDSYITFYFPELLEKYGLCSSVTSGEPPIPAYVSLYPTEAPIIMPDTVVDFATLKAWIIANIGTLVGETDIDEAIFGSDVASYNLENGMPDLNIGFKNGDIVCEARLKCWQGVGKPIVGATNPPTVPGIESTFVGEFRGDAYGGKIECDSLETKTIKAAKIGDENNTVGAIYAYRIGSIGQKVDKVYANNIGDSNNKVINVYANNIGSANSKVTSIYAANIGTSTSKVDYVYANNIGGSKNMVGNVFAYNVGHPSAKVEYIYATNIGSATAPVSNLYATNVILKNIPTSDPGVAGALWNDGGTLKISAGQQQA